MTKRKSTTKRKYKNGIVVFSIIFMMLFLGIYPLVDWGDIKEKPKPVWFNPNLADFLYEEDINQTTYNFNAYNESYIICKIQNKAYTSFTFNSSTYNVSYGLNYFPIDFGTVNQSYSIGIAQSDIDNDVFNWICVQPLIIDEDVVTTNLSNSTNISFDAGGLVSLLIQPNFTYNCLYVEIDGIIINDMYTNYTEYPKVDTVQLISMFFNGMYIQYDLNIIPQTHQMKLKGNGTIDYKIITASDWDRDLISDVEEFQQMELYSLLDPITSTVWGCYEMGDKVTLNYDYINETWIYTLYIPESYYGDGFLSMVIRSGKISDIQIDDEIIYSGEIFQASYLERSKVIHIKKLNSGFHQVQYKCNKLHSDVIFMLDGRKIFLRDFGSIKDSDGDGIKNGMEQSSGLNPFNPDTDYDGLIDSLDNSPTTSLILDKDKICQIIIPHNSTKNTLVDLTIKRPEENSDYFTEDTMIWKENTEGGGLEVSIQPVLRIFGNSSITMSELTNTWGKTNKTYSLTGDYPTYGDNVPNNEDEGCEISIIPGKKSEETFQFNFQYEIGHSAKSDAVIDIRFDIVWMVLSHHINGSEIIHYYEFDDDIVLQAMLVREVQNVSYILASPDSHIENQVLWNLVQNSELGSFSDFNVSDDVVSYGNVDFLKLTEQLIEDRKNNPISTTNNTIDENEVIYTSLEFSNKDILTKIDLLDVNITSEGISHYGDYSTFFSYYIKNCVDEEEDLFNLEDVNINTEICYTMSWDDYSDINETESYEQRYNIMGFPIYMKRITSFDGAEILEVASVIGSDIPLNKLPYSRSEILYDKIIYQNSTIIERDDSSSGIPDILFNNENDEYKEITDSRIFDVELGKLIFNSYFYRLCDIFAYLRQKTLKFNAILYHYLSDAIDDIVFKGSLKYLIRTDVWSGFTWTEKYFRWLDTTTEFYKKLNELRESQFNFPFLPKPEDYIGIGPDISHKFFKILLLEIEKDNGYANSLTKMRQRMRDGLSPSGKVNAIRNHKEFFKKQIRKTIIRNAITGVVTCVLGIISLIFTIIEFKELENYSEDIKGANIMSFTFRYLSAIIKFIMEVSLIVVGFVAIVGPLISSYIKATLPIIYKYLGLICLIFMVLASYYFFVAELIELYNSGADWVSMLLMTIYLAVRFITISILPIIVGAISGSWWGLIIGFIASIGWFIWELIWSWLNPRPTPVASVKISDDPNETYFELPEADIKRHGSLEVGDEVKFHLNITNDGTQDAWMRANFSAGGSDWSADQGKWDEEIQGHYEGGVNETAEYIFNRTLPSTQVVLNLSVGMEIDMDLSAGRENIYNEVESIFVDIPILDTNIADFYDDLSEWDKPDSYDALIREYKSIMDTYKHKDINETLSKLNNKIYYDWLIDDVGTMADDWNGTKSKYGNFTEILRPDGDIVTEWTTQPTGYSNHYDVLNDNVFTSATFTDSIDIYAGGLHDWDWEHFTFTNADVENCTEVKVHMYGERSVGMADNPGIYISFDGGDNWSPVKSTSFGYGYDWSTVSWTGLSETNVNDFEIKMQAGDMMAGSFVNIDVLYVEIIDTRIDNSKQEIVAEKDGHIKPMMIEVFGEDTSYEFKTTYTSTCPGSLEFWIYKDAATAFKVDEFFYISRDGNILEDDEETTIKPCAVRRDVWNYFRIEYNSSDFDLYVNGIKICNDISHSKTTFDEFYIMPYNDYYYTEENKYSINIVYIDAVDFSWDSDYYNGRGFVYDYSLANITYYDNLYDDLLINTNIASNLSTYITEMDTDTDIAEFDFDLILDGWDKSTTVNYTLSAPDGFTLTSTDFSQSLDSSVVFNISANNSYEYAGIYYIDMNITRSDNETIIYSEQIPFRIPVVEDFTISQAGIIFEENDFNGDYTATYDWLDDTVDTTPNGWTTFGITSYVRSGVGDHNHIVEMKDDGDTTATIWNTFSVQYNGTLELWIRKSSESVEGGGQDNNLAPLDIYITACNSEGGSKAVGSHIRLDLDSSGIIELIKTDGSSETIYTGFEQDKWYHVMFVVYPENDTSDFYLDGFFIASIPERLGSGKPCINQLVMVTGANNKAPNSNGIWSVDAVGYSWDSDYLIGDNMYRTEIESDTYGSSTQLKKGDIVNIEFKTNSMTEVLMNFLNNDAITRTYTIVPRGNLYSGIQFEQIIIKDTFSFDEIRFTSHEYNYFDVHKISIIDATAVVNQEFNPINFTNNGNIPKYITLETSEESTETQEGSEVKYDTGWVEAQTLVNVDRDGERSWLNPSNAKLEDGNNAIADVSKLTYSDWLRLTNFYNSGTGYDIPSEAIIDGIEVMIKRKAEANDVISDSSLRLRKASGQVGNDKASGTKYTTTLTWATYGSIVDNWGAGLTPSDINSADFGIDLSSANSHTKSRRMAYIDVIFIKIYYTMTTDPIEVSSYLHYEAILPNELLETVFNFEGSNSLYPNTISRGIVYFESGTNNIYNMYVDNLEIDGIHISSISENETINVIGDSLSSGEYEMKLDIIPEETLVWSGYSLDGQANITFSGTANITLSEIGGLHTIQVFGNNSIGTMFQSDLTNFTIQYPINIFIPEKLPYKLDGILTDEITISIVDIHSYKLDGFSKKAIVDDIIKCPSVRDHYIILYGDDAYGDEYRSEKYYFTVLPLYKIPSQPENMTISQGSLETYGDLEFIDGNYSVFASSSIENPLIRYIDSITYSKGSAGGGSVTNTYTDDSSGQNMNSGYQSYPLYQYWISITLNFDPSLAGRDYYISAHIESTGTGAGGKLLINGGVWKTGNDIDFDNELKTGVNSITYGTNPTDSSHTAKIFYFKLEDTNGDIAKVNFTVDMDIDAIDLYAIKLQYSHKTNISTTVDLDIWNWETSTWREIESIDNTASFDANSFTLGIESDYVNDSFYVRYRYYAENPAFLFGINIDQLRLEYSFELGDIINEVPTQPDNFIGASFVSQGDIEYLDGDYSLITSCEAFCPSNEYIDSITYTKGSAGDGSLENTQTDDSNYKQILRKKTYYGTPVYKYLYSIDVLFNIDPVYGGRDFYFSCDIVSGMSMYLYVNGGGVASGSTIDFDDMLISDVTSIRLFGNRWDTTFDSKVYYFKLVEVGETPAIINFTVDIQVDNPNCTLITTLQYSHRTNISIPIALDIWDWTTSSWVNIENVSNAVDFDPDFFNIGIESDYVNETFGVRVKFYGSHETDTFKLEIDRLRLDYTDYS